MNPDVILDITTWKVPYLIATLCRAIIIPYYMVVLSWKLTVLSLTLLVIVQLIEKPILKVSTSTINMQKDILIVKFSILINTFF